MVIPWALVISGIVNFFAESGSAGGIGDVSAWFRSQLPSTLPAGTVRALVALAFGGGIGLVLAAASRLAATPARDSPARELA